jgi:hypothetical protein
MPCIIEASLMKDWDTIQKPLRTSPESSRSIQIMLMPTSIEDAAMIV